MSIFSMPIVLKIKADTLEEAQESIDDWSDELDIDNDLPDGTQDIVSAPEFELDEDGCKVFTIPVMDDDGDDTPSYNDEGDDFVGNADEIPV